MKLLKSITKTLIITSGIIALPPSFVHAGETNTISVTGTGSESVAPDMALVSVGVVREAKTARAALDENNQAMTSILAVMEKEGIADKDLQTSGFSIQPRYFYPKRKSNDEQPAPEITGYIISNNLDIRIRDLSKTGEILDLVVTLGVNSGGNIRFLNEDTASILKKARISAVMDAVEKARTLAQAAEIELGDILSISENADRPGPVPIARARTFAVQEDAAAVPVAGGETSYSVNVQISWEIEQ